MSAIPRARWLACGLSACLAWASCALGVQAQQSTLLEIQYTPVQRAQVAIWIEDAAGTYLATVAVTEAVAYRGIGNRPGASLMNSGYRWPYGRREGALPIWARRRASAPGARLFPRVIFQNRVEGFASQTTSDQSNEDYFCLQFEETLSREDKLDAVSCATQFHSDKGRYATEQDVRNNYAEPWEIAAEGGAATGEMRAMPLGSIYPPRMDASPCQGGAACFDHPDLARFASDARVVMPEIDAVSRATAPGDVLQRILFTVPAAWPPGDYALWLEIHVEGDDNPSSTWNDRVYASPKLPAEAWDYYAKAYGYSYRGQPSLAYKVAFTLDATGDTGEQRFSTALPVGRSSWEHWAPDYGKLEPVSFEMGDPAQIADRDGSGADRLRRNADGERLIVATKLAEPGSAAPDPPSEPAGKSDPPPQPSDAGTEDEPERIDASVDEADAAERPAQEPVRKRPTVESAPARARPSIGRIEDLELEHYPNELRAHTWVELRFKAPRSTLPLFAYEVRVATEPIVDIDTFIRRGRPARNATDDSEGATALTLPVSGAEGARVEATIGGLVADTRYFVAVRATDESNNKGPISVAQIATSPRVFATVTPCFVASAAHGSPLAREIGVLRRMRDRHLMNTAPGRALVAAYYAYGPRAARVLEQSEWLRALTRAALRPWLALARWLP